MFTRSGRASNWGVALLARRRIASPASLAPLPPIRYTPPTLAPLEAGAFFVQEQTVANFVSIEAEAREQHGEEVVLRGIRFSYGGAEVTTAIEAAIATIASMALPPCASTVRPAEAARWWGAATALSEKTGVSSIEDPVVFRPQR